MSENQTEEQSDNRYRWKLFLNIFTLLALVILVFVSKDQIVQTFKNLGDLNAGILLTLVAWQALNFHGYTQMYRELFKTLGAKINYKAMYKVVLEMNFVNTVFPSAGVAGFSYFGLRMKREKVPASKSTLVQMMRFAMIFISFQVMLFLGVMMLAIEGDANSFVILIAGSFGTLLAVSTVAVTYIAGNKKRINSFIVGFTKIINKAIHYFRPSYPETIGIEWIRKLFLDLHEDYLILRKDLRSLKKPIINATLVNITDLLKLYVVFLAFGEAVNPGAVIIAFAVANFAGLISVLPVGIGIYEALMVGILVVGGVPVGVALPATVTYRILSLSMVVPVGYYFYHQAISQTGKSKKVVN